MMSLTESAPHLPGGAQRVFRRVTTREHCHERCEKVLAVGENDTAQVKMVLP